VELKGILVDEQPCALLSYDSGASSFTMISRPVAKIEARTVGSSHYWGDIYNGTEKKAAVIERST
jgi:hypothetical protein